MREKKVTNNSVLKKILITFAIIILVVALIIFGGYFYLKYALKIDILAIKSAIELLNKPVYENAIIENNFDDEDSVATFYKLYQNQDIYKKNGETYVFNSDEFEESSIQDETILTDNEFASLVSVFMQNIEEDDLNYIGKGLFLKQISFLSFESGEQSILRLKYVVELDLTTIKVATGESLFNTLSFSDYIPQKIYFSCEQDVSIDLFYEKFSSNECDILINNLSYDESASVLNLFSLLFGDDTETIKKDFSTVFPQILFGNGDRIGITQKIFGEGKFSFFVDGDNVKLRIMP